MSTFLEGGIIEINASHRKLLRLLLLLVRLYILDIYLYIIVVYHIFGILSRLHSPIT